MQKWIRVVGAAIGCLALTTLANAAEEPSVDKYRPVFIVNLSPDASSVVAAYLRAYRSPTPQVAIKRWESFLVDLNYSDSIEDLTDLTLLRQATLELMRLYYQNGRTAEGDQLLKMASDYDVYSLPKPAGARQWCRTNKYCE